VGTGNLKDLLVLLTEFGVTHYKDSEREILIANQPRVETMRKPSGDDAPVPRDVYEEPDLYGGLPVPSFGES
jgi:hypothetical protein